jgi:hypothetical protein
MSLETKQRGSATVASSAWPSPVIHKVRTNTA